LAVDITDQVAAEAQAAQLETQLMQAQKMETVGRLAGGIAHDFNNLMSVILSYSDFVAEDVQGNERASRDVAEIRRAGERAVALTSRLLAFSRKERVTSSPIDVASVVRGMHDLLHRTLHEDISLQFDVGDEPRCAVADVTQIEQVLLNLAVNAADAMPNGGTLNVTVADALIDGRQAMEIGVPAGDYIVLTVKDTGVGMDAETAARAFDPFFTTKDPGRGTGLGLSIVYNIATSFSGTAQIASEPGEGTSVSVYLPACERSDQGLVQVEMVPPPGSAQVLIVEDEPAVAYAARRILEDHGHTVTVATNPHHALKLIDDEPFDLLISDVVMPSMNGPQLAEQVRRHRPQMKILFMSGYAVATAGLASTDTVISKPLEPVRLLNAVHETLSREQPHDE
jgi:nitrogen-specific signal transduction histidine kinase/CheY-like chemotaxis protein